MREETERYYKSDRRSRCCFFLLAVEPPLSVWYKFIGSRTRSTAVPAASYTPGRPEHFLQANLKSIACSASTTIFSAS